MKDRKGARSVKATLPQSNQPTSIHIGDVLTMMTASDYGSLRASAEAAGQGHIFRFWDELNTSERDQLLRNVSKIDFVKVNTYYDRVMEKERSPEMASFDEHLEPLNRKMTSRSTASLQDVMRERDEWYTVGLELIAEGKVAVVLLAGGQGTRLGSDDPKGMYKVGLPSNKSLFQLQSERLRKVVELANAKFSKSAGIAYYIMTSGPTHAKTVNFFEENGYFGMEKKNVMFFQQNTLPCLSMEGKILMESKCSVAVAPDGNGGIYRAMVTEGVLDDMERRGVEHIHAYSVDNILVKVADPYFIGFSVTREAQTSLKVVPKLDPEEKVGVLCKYEGKYTIVEYSEVSERVRSARECEMEDGSAGRLVYDAGNICNHYFTMDFLRNVCYDYAETLTHHIAKKQIPCIDDKGNKTKLAGMKLELFIFDILQFASNVYSFYANRSEEFSPLKNAPGAADGTPQHCVDDLFALHKRFLVLSGAEFADENSAVEISPLVSYDGEGLRPLVAGKVFSGISQLQ